MPISACASDVEAHRHLVGLPQLGDGVAHVPARLQETAQDVGRLQGGEDAVQKWRQRHVLGMALQVPLQGTGLDATGRGGQVHAFRHIASGAGQVPCPPFFAGQIPSPKVEGERGKLGGTWIDVDTEEVALQDDIGDLRGAQLGPAFPIHSHQHVETFAQKVAAAHAGVDQFV